MIERAPESASPPGYSGIQPRIFLQPIAAPSILGLYGFAAATFIVAANMAHWFARRRVCFCFCRLRRSSEAWRSFSRVLVYRACGYRWVCMIAASPENMATSVVLAFLAAASTVCAIDLLMGNEPLVEIAGYLFVGSAVSAWYAASALMLKGGVRTGSLEPRQKRTRVADSPHGGWPRAWVIHGQA